MASKHVVVVVLVQNEDKEEDVESCLVKMPVKRRERCEGRTKFQFSKSVFHLENRRSVLLGTAGFCP